MACGFFVSGAGYPIYRSDTYHCTVTIKLSEDGGTAHVYTASAEIGQGSDTTMAMIAAEALGVPLDAIAPRIRRHRVRHRPGRLFQPDQTLMTGHATKEAAEDVKRQVLEVLGRETESPG